MTRPYSRYNLTLDDIRKKLDDYDFGDLDDGDDTPISFVGSVGNLRRMMRIIDAARCPHDVIDSLGPCGNCEFCKAKAEMES